MTTSVAPVTILGVSCAHESDRYGQRTWEGRLGAFAVRAAKEPHVWHLTLHGSGAHVIASGWSESFDGAHAELLRQVRRIRDALAGVP